MAEIRFATMLPHGHIRGFHFFIQSLRETKDQS